MIDLKARTFEEKIIDKLLLIYLLSKHKIDGKTKLQKTVFFTEDFMNDKKMKSFNYTFIRWHYGEFSKELEFDRKELVKNGLIFEDNAVTKLGKDLLKKAEGLLNKNSDILKRIDVIGDWTSSKSLDIVKTMAYTKITRKGIQVKDIEEDTVLLEKIEELDASNKFTIDSGWMGTLEILLDKNSEESLSNALKQKPNIPFMV